MDTSYVSNLENWLQGILVILTVYNLTAYLFSREKSALAYAIYLALVFLFIIPDIDNELSKYLNSKFYFLFNTGFWLIEVAWIVSYSYFSYLFLNLQEDKKLKKIFSTFFLYSLPVSLLVFLIDYYIFSSTYFLYYNLFIFVPVSLVLALLTILKILPSKRLINRMYLYAFSLLIICSLTSLYYTFFPETPKMKKLGINDGHFLMLGVFIEIIVISIALGVKNLIFRKESEKSNFELVKKLQENKKLKEKINAELQLLIKEKTSEVNAIKQEAENAKLTAIKDKFKAEINELKLTSLLSQMNPHFIFNALNSIRLFIVKNDSENAVYFLNKFSKLIRTFLNLSINTESTLQEELDTLRIYIKIENIRFENQLQFSIEVNDNIQLDAHIIPSLVLQPFLENAIWHGLSNKEGNKELKIVISKPCKGFIEIKIIDNGIGRQAAEKIKQKKRVKRKALGLKITKERLYRFSAEYCLSFIDLFDEHNKPSGTEVRLKIPINDD